jgi:hypothetical protein
MRIISKRLPASMKVCTCLHVKFADELNTLVRAGFPLALVGLLVY